MKWITARTAETEKAEKLKEELSQKYEFPLVLTNILLRKKIDSLEKAIAFFRPKLSQLHDPFMMLGMENAIRRIRYAIQHQEKILLYGDYDVDGTTSLTLLSSVLDDLKVPHQLYIPNRIQEGYGLSFKGIEVAASLNISLIITLDCGTKAIEKLELAKQKNIDVIICDHHEPGKQTVPAHSLVNPKQPDCNYPYKELSACGITLKLAQALILSLRKNPLQKTEISSSYDVFEKYIDLVTLSIASDIVPLTGENRILAYYGLQKLRINPLPGIEALMKLSRRKRKWTIGDLVFFIGPRINAAGRLGDARQAVELLKSTIIHQNPIAKRLDQENEHRRKIEEEITREALKQIQEDNQHKNQHTNILWNEKWHKGVIGIVASRIVEHHYRPTILLTKSGKHWSGSGRSVSEFNLYEAVVACSHHLLRFGGHKYAVGLTIEEKSLVAFKQAFEQEVKQRIRPEQQIPQIHIDAELGFEYIDEKFINIIKRFAPFGPGNPQPQFLGKSVQVKHAKEYAGGHLKLVLEQQGKILDAIAFNLAPKWNIIDKPLIDIIYQADINEWNGKKSIQLKIKDLKTSE